MAGYSVTIKAVDQATATVERINAKIAGSFKKTNDGIARVTAPVTRFGAALGKLGNTVGLDKVARGLGAVGRGLAGLPGLAVRAAGTLARIVPALGAITGAASLAGMAALIGKWAEFGQRLGFTSQRLGIGVEQLGALQGAARLAGSSSEAMTGGLRGLQQTMQDAVGGRNNDAVILFNKLGVSFRDADGNARGVTGAVPELCGEIAAIKNPQLQAMVATQLFGSAAEDLLPLLREGSAGLAKYQEEARKYGLVSGQGAEAARGFARAQTHLKMAVEGLGNKVAEKLAPILLPLLDKMATWIAAHGDEIANWFGAVATKLSEWVNNGGVQAMMERLETFAVKVDSVVQSFGGWQTVAIALGAVLALKVLSPLTGIVGHIGLLNAVKPAAWLLRLLGIGGSVSAGVAIAGGVAAHEGLNAVDPEDRLGTWIDKHVSGAGWLDDKASRIGLGRSYGEQERIRRDDVGKEASPGERRGAGLTTDGSRRPGDPIRSGNPRASTAPIGGAGYQQRAGGVVQRLMADLDLTHDQASGVVGNLGHESAGLQAINERNPLVPGSRGGFGWAQWTGPRRVEMEKWAADHGLQPSDPEANYGFLKHELENSAVGKKAIAAVRQTSGVEDATKAFFPFESGGDPRTVPAMGSRLRYAQLAAAAPAPGPPVPGPAAAGIAQPAAAPGVNGRVAVDVTHRGDPGNTNVRVSASGAAEQDKLRIERTPLLAGVP